MHKIFHNRFVRMLAALALIYLIWSLFVSMTNLHRTVDNDALIPCLFYLPPLGFFALGIILAKLLQYTVVIGIVKRFIKKWKKK